MNSQITNDNILHDPAKQFNSKINFATNDLTSYLQLVYQSVYLLYHIYTISLDHFSQYIWKRFL